MTDMTYPGMVLLAGLACAGIVACERGGPAEEAGKQVDQAVEQAGAAIQEGGERAEEAAETGGATGTGVVEKGAAVMPGVAAPGLDNPSQVETTGGNLTETTPENAQDVGQ